MKSRPEVALACAYGTGYCLAAALTLVPLAAALSVTSDTPASFDNRSDHPPHTSTRQGQPGPWRVASNPLERHMQGRLHTPSGKSARELAAVNKKREAVNELLSRVAGLTVAAA